MNGSQSDDWEDRFNAAQEAAIRIKAACDKSDNKLGDVVKIIESEQPLDPLVIINLALNESQALDRLRAEVKGSRRRCSSDTCTLAHLLFHSLRHHPESDPRPGCAPDRAACTIWSKVRLRVSI